jgi:low affinity Fe/Cu permease
MNGGNPSGLFSRFASAISELSGRPVTFALAVGLVLVWAISGPLFGFSETWQLIINTATTIVTFLMVFVLQNSQNRDGKALQAKLDELILTSAAKNKFIGIEKLDEEALQEVCEAHAEGVDSVEEILAEEILAEEILTEENAGPTAPR